MSLEELLHLEKLMNYIAFHFMKKSKWEEVSKAEWTYVSSEFNDLAKRKKNNEIDLLALGEHYFYEHLVIKRLKPWKGCSLKVRSPLPRSSGTAPTCCTSKK